MNDTLEGDECRGAGAGKTAGGRRWYVAIAIAIIMSGCVAVIWYVTKCREPPDGSQLDPSAGVAAAPTPPPENPAADDLAAPVALHHQRGYVTSAACRECHPDEYQSWHASFHRTMTQPATPATVVAPLEDTRLEAYDRTYHFQRQGDKFQVTLPSPEWEMAVSKAGADLSQIGSPPRQTKDVVLVTGSHHMQTFWVRGQDGLHQVPWYWHIEERRWIPSEDSFLRPPDAGRLFAMWNNVCIKCHAVGGIPGYREGNKYDTQVAELGIACEACHGSGQRHVEFHARRAAAVGTDSSASARHLTSSPPDETIFNPARHSEHVASQVCAQCHSSTRPRDKRQWLTKGSQYQPGDDFDQHFRLVRFGYPLPEDDYYIRDGYWADGTCRTGGDEYQGLIESACHERGELSCLSCHSLHQYADRDDQLKPGMEGNAACLQCHREYADRLTAHTHHASDSSGSLCYNCHMPHITYALFKGIRSHCIDSPSASVSARTGRPNACNLCHLDRTLQWTGERLSDWYRHEPPPANLSTQDVHVAASVVWLLRGDAAQRVIAAWHMGWPAARQASGDDWQAALLARALNDPYSAVRFVAWRSLKKLPGFERFEYDFLGSPEHRAQAVARAVARWREENPPAQPPVTTLLDEHGQLQVDAIEKLLSERDNRRVHIPE